MQIRFFKFIYKLVFAAACLANLSAAVSASLGEVDPELAAITEFLAADAMQGRGKGTEGHERAAGYLEQWLQDHGFTPLGGKGKGFRAPFDGGVNLLASISPDGEKARQPQVLISAHYDHLKSGCGTIPGAHSAICNGATDNAAAVAAVLTAALRIKDDIGAPVAVALWDGEEAGLAGSTAFVRKPTFRLKKVKLIINLDIIGLNLFKGMEATHMIMGAETGGAALVKQLDALMAQSPLQIYPLSYAFSHRRSDHTPFVTNPAGGTPIVFFTDGDGAQYHSCRDELDLVNYGKATQVSLLVGKLAVLASQPSTEYQFRAPPKTGAQYLPGYPDTKILFDLYQEVLTVSGTNGLNANQLDILNGNRKWLHRMNRAGADKFGHPEAQFLGSATQAVTQISREVFFSDPD